jgi:PPM family protein phosphatase
MTGTVTPSTRMPTLEAWGMTDPGLVRRNNEDSWFLDPSICLAVVADGMGGAECGEVASAIAVDTVAAYLRQPPVAWEGEQLVREAILEANRRVFEKAHADEACKGMGSTIVVARWSLPQVLIANVGDSRAYLLRQGAFRQVSYDQTLVNELRLRFGLTEEEVRNFPHKNVLTQAVGTTADVAIRMHEETLEPGDEILLCSDGLSGPVEDADLAATLGSKMPVRDQVEHLVKQAKNAGAPDNVTVVVLRYNGTS